MSEVPLYAGTRLHGVLHPTAFPRIRHVYDSEFGTYMTANSAHDNEFGTYMTVKARFWPVLGLLSGKKN